MYRVQQASRAEQCRAHSSSFITIGTTFVKKLQVCMGGTARLMSLYELRRFTSVLFCVQRRQAWTRLKNIFYNIFSPIEKIGKFKKKNKRKNRKKIEKKVEKSCLKSEVRISRTFPKFRPIKWLLIQILCLAQPCGLVRTFTFYHSCIFLLLLHFLLLLLLLLHLTICVCVCVTSDRIVSRY